MNAEDPTYHIELPRDKAVTNEVVLYDGTKLSLWAYAHEDGSISVSPIEQTPSGHRRLSNYQVFRLHSPYVLG